LNLGAKPGNPFEVFQLPAKFPLDKELLESRYLLLSRATHPDQVTEDFRSDSRLLFFSSKVNESYRKLKDDFLRAQSLLEIQECYQGLDPNRLPEGFLLSMLEIQEDVESYTDNPKDHQQSLEEIEERMESAVKESFREINHSYDFLGVSGADERQKLQEVKTQLNTVRYYRRVLESVERLLEEL
jgi:molecular chaperone HscB